MTPELCAELFDKMLRHLKRNPGVSVKLSAEGDTVAFLILDDKDRETARLYSLRTLVGKLQGNRS